LKKANINTIRDLVKMTEKELLGHKNFGRQSLESIKEALSALNLTLGMSSEELPPGGSGAKDADRG
ncbi:MAG TPA: DNA-directed RNA polymerase subunit alpha, partial [Proteobacteria bacterium]|nr:DNA-directed RNA polymerase subunit alpha [Pseudomonadota bacterium]